MTKPLRDESMVYLKAPRWALEQLVDFFAAMRFGGNLVDARSSFEAFNELRALKAGEPLPPNVAYANLVTSLLQACETRGAG